MENNEKFKGHFTTGEFARLCNVKKQTLFHYDEIGLLVPALKADNGYRYYAYQQFDLFSVIELLKDLDMPLKEIKQFIYNKTPEQLISLFEEKKKETHEKISHLKQMERIIDTKLEITKQGIATNFNDITVEFEEEEQFFISPLIENTSEKEFLSAVSAFIEILYTRKLDIGYPIGAILTQQQIDDEAFENYSYLYTKISEPDIAIAMHTKQAGKYITAYHIGEERFKKKSYDAIRKFANDRKLELVGDAYEEYVFEEAAVSNIEQYVTQIKMRVE